MQFIILGCGSSMGVPRIDGYFGNCDPSNKKTIEQDVLLLSKMEKKIFLLILVQIYDNNYFQIR